MRSVSKRERMNVVGIIPARMASSRFPGKPLAKIRGIPMVGHVYFRSIMCNRLDSVYIATCDDEIARYAGSIGAEAVMTSDAHQRASDRAAEAMLKIEKRTGRKADIVVMIQGDEPMLYPGMIEEALSPILKDGTIGVVNLMSALKTRDDEDNPNIVKAVTDLKNFAVYFSREPIPSRKKASDNDVTMYKQIAIIPFRRDMLLKFNKLEPTPLEIIESVDMLRFIEHGYRIKMAQTKYDICGVDTPEDLERVEELMVRDELSKRYKGGRQG